MMITLQPEKKKTPNLYVPSYLYQSPKVPTIQRHASSSQPQHASSKGKSTSKEESLSHSIELPSEKSVLHVQKKQEQVKKVRMRSSMFAASLQMIQQEALQSMTNSIRNEKPIYLVGEENAFTDPFIKMLGEALSANFRYPRLAGELGIKGRVLVSLVLHPEGYFSDVQIVQSSDNQDLDAAALYAVNQAPLVEGADRFLSKPTHFVVGFIFH